MNYELGIHAKGRAGKNKNQNSPFLTRNLSSSSGFTLIEVIIYVALVSVFISGAIFFAWDIIYGRVKSQVQIEVNQNLRLASDRISFEIRNADSINSVSGSSLSLSVSDSVRDPTVFDVSGGRLRIGYGGAGPCPITSPCNLTSDLVTVANLTFTDLSVGIESANVRFTITVASNNPSGRQEWERSQTYSTAVELRSN